MSNNLLQKIKADINSQKVIDGCQIVIEIAAITAPTLCLIPNPASPTACAITSALTYGGPAGAEIIQMGATEICTVTYATGKNTITMSIDFFKNQLEELARTIFWIERNWQLQIMNYQINNSI